MTSILERWFPFTKRADPLQPGMYASQPAADAPIPYRLHLRLEPDGSGVLLVNAATVLHLNASAAAHALELIRGVPVEAAAAAVRRRFRVSRGRALADQIRNPLASISGAIEALSRELPPDARRGRLVGDRAAGVPAPRPAHHRPPRLCAPCPPQPDGPRRRPAARRGPRAARASAGGDVREARARGRRRAAVTSRSSAASPGGVESLSQRPAVHARREPGEVALRAHHVVLRDLPPRAARCRPPALQPRLPLSVQLLLQRRGRAVRAAAARDAVAPGSGRGAALPRARGRTHARAARRPHAAGGSARPRRARPAPRAAASGAILTDVKHLLSLNPLAPACRAGAPSRAAHAPLTWSAHPGGEAQIGHDGSGFAFDNELPRHRALLAPFELASRPATNDEYLAFIEDGGYRRPELWLSEGWATQQAQRWEAPLYWRRREGGWMEFTLHGLQPLDPHAAVVHLSHFEADAFARWSGARLPTEFEMEAAGGAFADVWQWTSSSYGPYPGYRPAPGAVGEYNGKFMSNQYVLRGGSSATPRGHLRASYRNFFPSPARWQFSGVRVARDC